MPEFLASPKNEKIYRLANSLASPMNFAQAITLLRANLSTFLSKLANFAAKSVLIFDLGLILLTFIAMLEIIQGIGWSVICLQEAWGSYVT